MPNTILDGYRATGEGDAGLSDPRLALVLWDGDVGGAEILNATLAVHLRRLGAEVTVLFVGRPGPLGERLATTGVPYRSLGLGRGRNVLRHPRRYAQAVAE